jgi:hypothetical protein
VDNMQVNQKEEIKNLLSGLYTEALTTEGD